MAFEMHLLTFTSKLLGKKGSSAKALGAKSFFFGRVKKKNTHFGFMNRKVAVKSNGSRFSVRNSENQWIQLKIVRKQL